MTEKLIEKRLPRSIFGKTIKWIFILFNLFMAYGIIAGFNNAYDRMDEMSNEWERAGANIGTGLEFMFFLMVWGLGVIILTPILFLTRRNKVLEKIEDKRT